MFELAICLATPIQGPGWAVHHGHQSTPPHTNAESQTRPEFLGQITANQPPQFGSTPPMFAFLSLFSFLLFILFLINCFPLIYQIIFKIQKKSENHKIKTCLYLIFNSLIIL